MIFSTEMFKKPLLWDGAIGTELAKLEWLGEYSTVEGLNLTAPDAVRSVHQAYVAAGADLLQTNSYQATRLSLEGQGLTVEAVNQAAVHHARVVAEGASRQVWVAGAIGPLEEKRYAFDILTDKQMQAVYAEQVQALVKAGVDLLLAETISDLREALAIARAARAIAPHLPLIVQLAVLDQHTLGGRIDLDTAVKQLEQVGVDAIGINCRVGPATIKRTAQRLLELTDLPISIQPNAAALGIDYTGRMESLGEAKDFAQMARWAVNHGIMMVGGCCHSTPRHIMAMRQTLDSLSGLQESSRSRLPRSRSRLERKLGRGEFLICVEIDPPTDDAYQRNPGILQQKIDGARYLEERHGVDVITIADHTMGKPWLDPFPFAETIRPHLQEADILLHYSCRNKAETDITGNFAGFKLYGYRNILIITGDPPANPDDDSFFRYSSVKLLNRINEEHPAHFLLACAFDHTRGIQRGVRGIEGEVRRLERKMQAGAELALTQPVFLDRLDLLHEKTKDLAIPILPGVMPIFSLRHAETVSQFGGILIPDYVKERMAAAGTNRQAKTAAAIEIAGDVARRIKELGFPGIYIISSFNRFDVIAGMIRRMNEEGKNYDNDTHP